MLDSTRQGVHYSEVRNRQVVTRPHLTGRQTVTKAQTAQVVTIVEGWMMAGVPAYITRYEAHRLTGGVVGDPIGVRHSYAAIHLRDVALRMITTLAVR